MYLYIYICIYSNVYSELFPFLFHLWALPSGSSSRSGASQPRGQDLESVISPWKWGWSSLRWSNRKGSLKLEEFDFTREVSRPHSWTQTFVQLCSAEFLKVWWRRNAFCFFLQFWTNWLKGPWLFTCPSAQFSPIEHEQNMIWQYLTLCQKLGPPTFSRVVPPNLNLHWPSGKAPGYILAHTLGGGPTVYCRIKELGSSFN